jgi:hypothetical protein
MKKKKKTVKATTDKRPQKCISHPHYNGSSNSCPIFLQAWGDASPAQEGFPCKQQDLF